MDSTPQHRVFSLSVGEDVHRAVRQLRLMGGLMVLALLLVVLAAAAGAVIRLVHPRQGQLSAVVVSGLVGIAALAAGVAVLEVVTRRAKAAETLALAVAAYRRGCVIAGGLNFVAGLYTVSVIFANGPANGLWVPQVLIVAVNVLGMVLAVPRVKHLRRLHYSPTLPYSHV